MNTKMLKAVITILMAVMVVFSMSQSVSADTASGIASGITANTSTVNSTELQGMAGKILGLIQVASAVAAVVLIAVFGFKFILGSASEKADYQKSFIPLIVGVVVVFAATSIAQIIFSTFGS